MNDTEMSQHHQAKLWRAVLLLEESLCASMHKQAPGQQPAVGDEAADRITQKESELKNKRKEEFWSKMSDFHELKCLVPPMCCSFKSDSLLVSTGMAGANNDI